MDQPRPQAKYIGKNVGFSEIRTRIVKVEGKQADHQNNTKSPSE